MGPFAACCGIGSLIPPDSSELTREQRIHLYRHSLALNKGKLIVHGLFARADVVNVNKRLYPKRILRREVRKYLKHHIRRATALGELDHPSYSSQYFRLLNLPNVSHQVLEVHWRGSQLWGTIEVLPTPSGLLLWELYAQGIKLGVSSRGWASLVSDPKTQGLVVDDDFELITFDFVADPSNSGAFLYPIHSRYRRSIPDQTTCVQLSHLHVGSIPMGSIQVLPNPYKVQKVLQKHLVAWQQSTTNHQVTKSGGLRPPPEAAKHAVPPLTAPPASVSVDISLQAQQGFSLVSHYHLVPPVPGVPSDPHGRNYHLHLSAVTTRAHVAEARASGQLKGLKRNVGPGGGPAEIQQQQQHMLGKQLLQPAVQQREVAAQQQQQLLKSEQQQLQQLPKSEQQQRVLQQMLPHNLPVNQQDVVQQQQLPCSKKQQQQHQQSAHLEQQQPQKPGLAQRVPATLPQQVPAVLHQVEHGEEKQQQVHGDDHARHLPQQTDLLQVWEPQWVMQQHQEQLKQAYCTSTQQEQEQQVQPVSQQQRDGYQSQASPQQQQQEKHMYDASTQQHQVQQEQATWQAQQEAGRSQGSRQQEQQQWGEQQQQQLFKVSNPPGQSCEQQAGPHAALADADFLQRRQALVVDAGMAGGELIVAPEQQEQGLPAASVSPELQQQEQEQLLLQGPRGISDDHPADGTLMETVRSLKAESTYLDIESTLQSYKSKCEMLEAACLAGGAVATAGGGSAQAGCSARQPA